jgi:hypothetical protein
MTPVLARAVGLADDEGKLLLEPTQLLLDHMKGLAA